MRGQSCAPIPRPVITCSCCTEKSKACFPSGTAAADRATFEITAEELGVSQWSYVALGHYHVHRQVAPNAFYSGSIDYTSSNAWGERAEERAAHVSGKGIVEHDMATGAHRFHPIANLRPVEDLPAISVRGMTGTEVDTAIRAAVEACPGGIDDKIVRLVVRDVARHVNNDLDHKALREYKRRAFHFQLEMLRPNVKPRRGDGAPGRRQSLADFVQERLQSRSRPPDIDQTQLIERVFQYLDQAAATELAAAGESEG